MIKALCASAFIFLSAAALWADGFDAPISDRDLLGTFEKELGALLEAKKTAPPEELAGQLKSRKSAEHALAKPECGELDTASVYQRARAGVLCFGHVFKCDKCDKWHGNIAGGFVISADGLAVTNYHVMVAERPAAFGAMDIEGKVYAVKEVVAASKADDLAIVRLEGEGFAALPVAEGDAVGAEVTVISHPEGRFYTVSEGIISRYYRSREKGTNGSPRMAISADFARGSSGCPVLNDDGAVVGVVASTDSIYYNKKEGIERNLQMVIKSCIPSAAIRKLLGNP